MNCYCCEAFDGSVVPAVAPNECGVPLCLNCIKRDAVRVICECPICWNEHKAQVEAWLDGDYRCYDCADSWSRACADADAGRR